MAAGAPHEVLQYHHNPRDASFGEEAAAALARDEGVDAEQVFKTLILALSEGPRSGSSRDIRLGVAVLPVPALVRVLCSAGRRGWDVAVNPQVLIRLTNAITADIRA